MGRVNSKSLIFMAVISWQGVVAAGTCPVGWRPIGRVDSIPCLMGRHSCVVLGFELEGATTPQTGLSPYLAPS